MGLAVFPADKTLALVTIKQVLDVRDMPTATTHRSNSAVV